MSNTFIKPFDTGIETAGETVVAQSQAIEAPPRPKPFDLRSLTPRQLEVLRLLASGLTQKQIAEALDISVNTLKDHLSALMRKAGASNRCHLTAIFAAQYKDHEEGEPHK